jgi:hydroxyacylglutathione hydrolase
MFFRQVYDEKLAQAAYLIGCQKTGEAIVIDPERDIDRYEALAKANGLRIVAAADTHIHADFLSGVREFAERARAPMSPTKATPTGSTSGSTRSRSAAATTPCS